MISLTSKHFVYCMAPADPNTNQQLDVNYRGANHVFDGQWTVADFQSAQDGQCGFTLASGQDRLAAGDYIVLVDPAMGQDRAEFTRVAHVQGGNVWLDQPLSDSFGPGFVAKVPADRVASHITLQNWQVAGGENGVGIWSMFVDGLDLRNVWSGRCANSAMRFDFCRNVRLSKCQVWDDAIRAERGRGLDFYNCNRVRVDGASATGCRHAYHFSNAREVNLARLSAIGSQDASIDFHGRNSSGIARSCYVDGCVKVGNPSYPRGMDTIELVDVHTGSWYQVHGGCTAQMIGCRGRNVLLAGYSEAHAPKVALKRCKIVLPDGPSTQAGPVVCFNVTGPYRKFSARMEGCELRSEIQGRWTCEIFMEAIVAGSELVLVETPAERIIVSGYDPIRRRAS